MSVAVADDLIGGARRRRAKPWWPGCHACPRAAVAACEGGAITRAPAGGGLQESPPLTITQDQVQELAAGLRAALDAP